MHGRVSFSLLIGAAKPELRISPLFALKVLEGEGSVVALSNGEGGPARRATQSAPASPGSPSGAPAAILVERFVFEVTQAFSSSGKPKPSVFLAAGSAAERDTWVKAINDGKRNAPRGPRTMV
jgi:hypothetical protein